MKALILTIATLCSMSVMAFDNLNLISSCEDKFTFNSYGDYEDEGFSSCIQFQLEKFLTIAAFNNGADLQRIDIDEDTNFEMKFSLAKSIHRKNYKGGSYTSPDGEYGSTTSLRSSYKAGESYYFIYENIGGEWSREEIRFTVFEMNDRGEVLNKHSESMGIN